MNKNNLVKSTHFVFYFLYTFFFCGLSIIKVYPHIPIQTQKHSHPNYLVEKQETLSEILDRFYPNARLYGPRGLVHKILQLNPQIRPPYTLRKGQKIFFPSQFYYFHRKTGKLISAIFPVNDNISSVIVEDKEYQRLPRKNDYLSTNQSLIHIRLSSGLRYFQLDQKYQKNPPLGESAQRNFFQLRSFLSTPIAFDVKGFWGHWGFITHLEWAKFTVISNINQIKLSLWASYFLISWRNLAMGPSLLNTPQLRSDQNQLQAINQNLLGWKIQYQFFIIPSLAREGLSILPSYTYFFKSVTSQKNKNRIAIFDQKNLQAHRWGLFFQYQRVLFPQYFHNWKWFLSMGHDRLIARQSIRYQNESEWIQWEAVQKRTAVNFGFTKEF
jgi:hypothetical protein